MNAIEYLNAPIIPNSQMGSFKLGEVISSYGNRFKPAEYDLWNVKAIYPKYYEYCLLESLTVLVNIFSAAVCKVTAQNRYEGKYLDKIGIGTPIGTLLEVRSDVSFDMEHVMIGEDCDLVLRIDNDDSTIHSLDEIVHNRIIEIIVEDRKLF
jgi:hypothetical protein